MDSTKLGYEPIYYKVYNNFKTQILNGILKPNDKMPSVRDVATTMMVNPNTVQRAFSELERDGFIYAIVGKGNFVSEKISDAKDKVVSDLKNNLNDVIVKLISLGINKNELIKEIEKMGGKKND